MNTTRSALIILSVMAILLASCGNNTGAPAGPDANAVSTSLIGTLVAGAFQTQTALAPTSQPFQSPTIAPITAAPLPTLFPTPTRPVYIPTVATPVPVFIPSVTGTVYTPTTDPGSLSSGCNNLEFVRDVTYPKGSVLQPREDFAKTWKVANIGSCDWVYQYTIVFVSGDEMGGKDTKLGRVVTSGHWAEITVEMGAPKSEGTYTGYWRMADADGNMFGSTLEVSIEVSETPADTATP